MNGNGSAIKKILTVNKYPIMGYSKFGLKRGGPWVIYIFYEDDKAEIKIVLYNNINKYDCDLLVRSLEFILCQEALSSTKNTKPKIFIMASTKTENVAKSLIDQMLVARINRIARIVI